MHMNTEEHADISPSTDTPSPEDRAAILTRIELMDQELSSLKESVGVKNVGKKDTLLTALSIVIAGVIVMLGIVYSAQIQNKKNDAPAIQGQGGGLEKMRPVSAEDHIIGRLDAPVKIVEYSDLECPFCKMFHQTLGDIMKKYGSNGQVAWVYRHLPLEMLHTKAFREAIASECAYAQKGNDGFWRYINDLFSVTPSNDGLPLAELPNIAQRTGLSVSTFSSCLDDTRMGERVSKDRGEAVNIGADGTPFSVIIAPDGSRTALYGAQNFAQVDQAIQAALSRK